MRTPGQLAVAATLAALVGCSATDGPLPLDLRGQPVDVRAGSPPASLLIFMATDCPISNRYAPELRRLREEFEEHGVVVSFVYADPDTTADAIRRHLEEYGHGESALRDVGHGLVRSVGATVTPEAVVLASDGSQVYRGRIDNWYTAYGKSRPEATEHDVRDVLTALLAGEKPAPRTTRAVGCYIQDLE